MKWIAGLMVPALLGAMAALVTSQTAAQNNSTMTAFDSEGQRHPMTMAQGNLIRSIPIEPRKIQKYDIISIRVDELARMQADGTAERRKNASYNAIINDWIRLNGLRKAERTQNNGSGTDPQVQGNLQQLYRAEGEVETTERLTFNIAARIVDIRPNGNLVLEAHKEVRVNNDVWRASLSGTCRQEDIGPDRVILSRNIVDLRVDKYEVGHTRDSYRRGWFLRMLDRIHPF